jgi:2-oxoglutarate dehydrogenase E1 component
VQELAEGRFREVISETEGLDPARVRRVVFCSGKVYYDLLEARREKNLTDAALIRVEQLYPYPADAIAAEIARYAHADEVVWAQEEPENQGSWDFVRDRLKAALRPSQKLVYAGRPIMAAPSGGDYHRHLERQKELVESALGLSGGSVAAAAGK